MARRGRPPGSTGTRKGPRGSKGYLDPKKTIEMGLRGHGEKQRAEEDFPIYQASVPLVQQTMKDVVAKMEAAEQIGPARAIPFFDPDYTRKATQLELLKKLQLRELAEIGKLDFWTFMTEI